MTSYSLILYLHLVLMRDRIALGLMLLPFLITCFSWFLGSTLILEQQEATFAFTRLALRYSYLLTLTLFLISFWHDLLKSEDWLIFRASSLSDIELISVGWINVIETCLLFSAPLFLCLIFFGGYEGISSAVKMAAEGLMVATLCYCLLLSRVSRVLCLSLALGFYLLAYLIPLFKNLSHSPYIEVKFALLASIASSLTSFIPHVDHLWEQSTLLFLLKSVLFSLFLLGVLRASWQR